MLEKEKINKKDIGLCYSNIGYSDYKLYHESSYEEKMKFFSANLGSHTLMGDYFVKLFLNRKTRSGLAFTSSAEAYIIGHKVSMYHISKRALTALGSVLHVEYPQIDVLTVHPSAVTGRVLSEFAKKVGNKSEFKAVAVTEGDVAHHLLSRLGKISHSDVGLTVDAVNIGARILGNRGITWVHKIIG